MSSPETIVASSPEISYCLYPFLNALVSRYGFVAAMISHCAESDDSYKVLASIKIDAAPFNGTKSKHLNDFLVECHAKYSAAHAHSLKSTDLWNDISDLHDNSKWLHRCLFIPFICNSDHLDFLFFSDASDEIKLDPDVLMECRDLGSFALSLMETAQMQDNLKVMEHYVKEIGHDLASSVQAIIPKLRNVRKGNVYGAVAELKLEEAEEEIMSIYRSADTLGIAIDSNYNIRNGGTFNICDIASFVKQLCSSEAGERDIEIEIRCAEVGVDVWGDSKAIESAITQYMINAIKYSRGSTTIFLDIKEAGEIVTVSVTNVGISIDEELGMQIWGFGVRGRQALERHANGCGIGLFTVKKIILAHGGRVGYEVNGADGKCNTFYFEIPKKDFIQKSQLL